MCDELMPVVDCGFDSGNGLDLHRPLAAWTWLMTSILILLEGNRDNEFEQGDSQLCYEGGCNGSPRKGAMASQIST